MPAPPAQRLRQLTRERGPLRVAAASLGWGAGWVVGRALSVRPPRREFELDGETYRSFHHPYNWTWLNERAVELPVAFKALERASGPNVLEVGNVLGNYSPVAHRVVDKYERGPGIENRDVLELDADERFDLIVSISTLEHVGFDEEPREPGKAVRAVEALKARVAPGGRLLATVPVGYNPALDEALRSGGLGIQRVAAMRRTSAFNRWEQVALGDVWDARYDFLLFTAHGLLVCDYERPR